MDRAEARMLAEEITRAQRGGGGGGGGGGRGGGGAGLVDGVTSSIGSFGEAIKKSVPSLHDLESKYKSTVEKIGASLDTWRELSKTGVTFGNDILAMQTAAKGARMELGDFNEIVSQNRASLAGWGGSIDKGAKDFARVSKQMFDEYTTATDSLRQLGYTNKDLNEVLALQMSAIGTSMADGKAKDEAAIKAATELATEMDLMAKMTGKTREEQMEAQKKLQMDQAFQAKMALETQGMDEKQALEYTTKMKEEYNKAEAQGLGQVFKEQFLYGTVVTKEASMQLVASGKAGLAVSEQAKAAAEGNFKLAAEKSKEAYAEAGKMAKDPAVLQMRVISGLTGDFGKATANFAKETEALAKGIEGLRKKIEKETGQPVTTEQAAEAYRDQARKAQKDVPPSTATVVNVEQRAKDAASAFQSGFVDPLIKQSYPAIEKFNKELVGAKGALTEFIKGAEAASKGGFNAANSGKASKDVPLLQQPTYKAAQVQDAFNRGVAGETRAQYDKRRGSEPVKLAEGGVVESKPGGTPAIIGEGGKTEAVIPLDKLDSMLKSNGKAGNIPGIDLSKIGKDISTTTSKVEVTNWPIEITELKKLTPVQTQPAPAAKAAEPKKEEAKPATPDQTIKAKLDAETKGMNEREAAEYKQKAIEKLVKEQPSDPKASETKSESYKINGKEVDKKEFDKHMEANPELANLMNGIKPKAGGDAAGGAGGGNNMTEAEAAMERMKALQAQIGKDLGEGAAKELDTKKSILETTQKNLDEEWNFKKKAADDLTSDQKSMLKEMSGLTLEEANARVKAHRDKNHAVMEEMADAARLTDAIKYQALTQNRALTEKEQAEIDAIEKPIKEKQEREREANAKSIDEYKALQVLIEEKSKDISKDMKDALPVQSMQDLTKKSEELAKRREGIEERLAANQARAAQLREIAGERDLTAKEKEALKFAEFGVKRAENNLKRNLEDQAKLDEALGKVKKESNENELKSVEQQARDKMELDAINNDEELEAAQIDAEAQAKFTYVDKDKIGEDIDSVVPSTDSRDAEKAARDKMELDAIDNDEELEAAQIDAAAQAKFTHVDKDKIGEDIDSVVPSKGASDAEMKAIEAQDNIDKAIERQKEAQQKLNDLLMGASEDDAAEQYEIYAQELSEANENLAKVVDESFSDLIGTVEDSSTDFNDSLTQVSEDINNALPDEFGGVDEAIGEQMLQNMDLGPKYSEQAATPAAQEPADTLDRSKISFGKISKIDPKTGLPVMVDPKKDDKNLPKVENPDDARENAKFKRQAEESKKAAEKTEEDKKGKPGEKGEEKTLNDVVKTLEKLNTAMEKLIAVNNANTSLMRDQIKATKTSGTRNLYEAH